MNLLLFGFLLLISWGLPAAAAQSEAVEVKGTKVRLVPPPGLSPSKQFPGFINEESGASIMVTEMPAPYSETIKTFNKESLAARGMTLLSSEAITINGNPGQLLHLRQPAQFVALKWIVVTGTNKEMVLITATFPEELKSEWSLPMRKSLLEAKWDTATHLDPLADLPFSFQGTPELRFAKRVSNMILLTATGELTGKPNNDPLFIIGSSISQVVIDNEKDFAETRLYQHDGISVLKIRRSGKIVIDNLSGYEIVAEGRQTKEPRGFLTVYQIMLFDGNNYFLMLGLTPKEKEDKYLTLFDRISATFRKK